MANRIENIVEYYSKRDLSGDEIKKMIDKEPILYSDLKNYTFNKLLSGAGDYQVILLQTKAINIGHYVAVFISPDDKNIYYYDSYGLGNPDTYKNYTPYDKQLPDYLSNLLASDPRKRQLIVNNKDMQSWSRQSSTCGRWSSLRILYKTLNNDEFDALFVGNKGFLSRADYVATILTLNGLDDIQEYYEK
jgi:hypothetical protein